MFEVIIGLMLLSGASVESIAITAIVFGIIRLIAAVADLTK